jgi:hypothetical protein
MRSGVARVDVMGLISPMPVPVHPGRHPPDVVHVRSPHEGSHVGEGLQVPGDALVPVGVLVVHSQLQTTRSGPLGMSSLSQPSAMNAAAATNNDFCEDSLISLTHPFGR